jgi:hypothetical protein
MTKSNFWIKEPVSPSSVGFIEVHQASKDFFIDVLDSAGTRPSLNVCISRGDSFSIRIPGSSKSYKVSRILENDFLPPFLQTLATFRRLETGGGEYYINTDDYSECYQLEAFFEKPHTQLSLFIDHAVKRTNCSLNISRSFAGRVGIRRHCTPIPESVFRQVFNLMLEFCSDRDAYTRFQDTLFAQVQALVCNGKPVGSFALDAGMYFEKARAEMLDRRKSIELRLVSADEPPQKRRELRAEMKGIDFCISVLDANR